MDIQIKPTDKVTIESLVEMLKRTFPEYEISTSVKVKDFWTNIIVRKNFWARMVIEMHMHEKDYEWDVNDPRYYYTISVRQYGHACLNFGLFNAVLDLICYGSLEDDVKKAVFDEIVSLGLISENDLKKRGWKNGGTCYSNI